jgi:hypothetical protein
LNQLLFPLIGIDPRAMRQLTGKESHDSHPALAHVLGSSKDEDFERSVAGIHAVVEELSERPRLLRSSCLSSIDSIKGLIQEQSHGPRVVHPAGAVLIQTRVVPQQCQEVGHDEHEARQRDQIGRHAHREALDDHIRVEGLEDVLGGERPVHGRVLVLLEARQLFLSHVHHLGGASFRFV